MTRLLAYFFYKIICNWNLINEIKDMNNNLK